MEHEGNSYLFVRLWLGEEMLLLYFPIVKVKLRFLKKLQIHTLFI